MGIEDIIQVVLDHLDSCIDSDFEEVLEVLTEQGIDMTQYSADDIREIIDNALNEPENSYSVTFGARPDWEIQERNFAKSTLLDKLKFHRIYPSTIETDNYYGGLTSYAEDKVLEAINKARDNKNISDSIYRELFSLLKKASH